MKRPILSTTFVCTALVLAAAAAVSCDKPATPPSAAGATTGAMTLPVGLVVTEELANAVPVGTCKQSKRTGDKVTVVGRIGGAVAPFNASRAVFTIIDPALKSCAEGGDADHCATPWDYCCEPPDSLRKNMATIEIADADGKVLPFSVSGAQGLKPLAQVTVVGTVIEQNDKGVFLVRAERISVK